MLEVDRLKKYYELADGSLMALVKGGTVRTVKANEQLDFVAREAQTVAIVGESGCGKSTFAKVMMGLETATEGEIRLNGKDIADTPVQQRQPQTVSYMQMVFQNPFDTLNPSHIGRQPDRPGGAQVRRRAAIRPRSASGCSSCWTRSSCRAPSTTAGRASSRAARSSGSASPARSPATPRW